MNILQRTATPDKEYFERLIEAIDSYGAKSSGSEEKARAALRSIGVLDERGNIAEPFRKEPEMP